MPYVADIEWKERTFDTVEEVLAACRESMKESQRECPCLQPMIVENEMTTVTNKAGTVYHSQVHSPIDLDRIKADLAAGKRVCIASHGLMEDGTPLSGADTVFIWEQSAHAKYVAETQQSAQQFADQTGYTLSTAQGQNFKPKRRRK
jgi:hypothetical protein